MSDAPPDTPVPVDGSEIEPSDAGASMRLAGFGLTALGGLLIGVGALMPWVRSGLEDVPDELSLTYYGIDLPDGRIALAAAVVVLAGLVVARFAAPARYRRTAAWAVVANDKVMRTAEPSNASDFILHLHEHIFPTPPVNWARRAS